MKAIEYIKKIKNYVSNDELGPAIKEFNILVHETELNKSSLQLSGRFADYLRQIRNGTVTNIEATVIKNKIRYDLVELLGEVEMNKENYEREINKSEKEYLSLIEKYNDEMTIRELTNLGRRLKGLGRAMFELDFITDRLKVTESRGIIFGGLCAIQVNPNPKYYDLLIEFLDEVAGDDNLHNIRLRIVYRLVMCVENIIHIDNNRMEAEISSQERAQGISALNNLSENPRCKEDEKLRGKKGIVYRINRVLNKMTN